MKLFILLFSLAAATIVTAAELISYSYDSAGRLTAAQYGGGKSASWQYDPAGNLTRSAQNVIADSDNDGIADAWETLHFQTLARDGTTDFDNDGFSDLAEFLADTLPKDPNSLLRMDQAVTNNLVQTTVRWTSVSGKRYRVQYKDDLNAPGWNDLPGDVTASGPVATKTDVTTAVAPRRFYRVIVVF